MKIVRASSAILGILCVVFCVLLGGKISNTPKRLKSNTKQTVITLWHVDTFEGGQGSRKQFLLKTARRLESVEQGVLVSVIEHTPESIKDAFDKGQIPDMVSYANGIRVENLKEISINLEFSGGNVDGKTYALPWCRGGYVVIAKKSSKVNVTENAFENMIVSKGAFNQPLCALALEEIRVKNIKILSPQDAFWEFVNSKDGVMIGTQRDIVRANNLNLEISSRPLTKFNDLFQYVSVTTNDQAKNMLCQKYLSVLFSLETQKELTNLSMLSNYYSIGFENEHLQKLQQLNSFSTLSAFADSLTLKNVHSLSEDVVSGQINMLDKLKNLTV